MARSRRLPIGRAPRRAEERRRRGTAKPSFGQTRRCRVTVVIPSFNQAALTDQCLRSLRPSAECEIIVVNDASTDGTAQVLAGYAGRIKVVTHERNTGFARTCNDGAAAAQARDYLVFLNSDTIAQPGWLTALVRYADKHPEAAVVGSKLLYPNNTIQHAGVVICQDRYPRHIYTGFPADHPAVNKSRPFQMVTAASLLVRRRAFERCGGFDTAYRNGFEDVDLCLQLRERGQEIHYCAQSVLYHLESLSPNRFDHERDNIGLYRQRWLERVRPDDLNYYLEDGLLRFSYEGRYPVRLEVSPRLATQDGVTRGRALERLVRERNQQLADLERENTRLRARLGAQAQDAPELRYRQLRKRIRELVRNHVPTGATVLVISKGDGALLELPGRRGWHFPQTEHGTYAGYHPADSAEAIAHLESLRAKGGGFLLIPQTSQWWLEHYAGFRRHLQRNYVQLTGPGGACSVYDLNHPTKLKPTNVLTRDIN
jgi:GT2 family glycosyltransferase